MTSRRTSLLIVFVVLIASVALIALNLFAPSTLTGPSEHDVITHSQSERPPGGAQEHP